MISLKEESFSENDIIDPDWVIRYLANHLPKKNINAEDAIKIIKKMCKRISGVRISYQRLRSAKDMFIVHGLFDDVRKKSIKITICCSSYKKRFDMDNKIYAHLVTEVADALCHESVHRYQYSSRCYDPDKYRDDVELDYYADPDEMFAYAINIAHNFNRKFGDQSIDKLKKLSEAIAEDGYLADYYSLFYNTPRFHKLLKMIYQNLISINQGRIVHRPQL